MKKMKFTAVLVLMMSATSAFADATCADIAEKIALSQAEVTQAEQFVKATTADIKELEREILENPADPFIVGSGNENKTKISLELMRMRATNLQRIQGHMVHQDYLKSLQAEKNCAQ